jgi:hypothetical protein
MSYDLQAEGINGVVSETLVTANAAFTTAVWHVNATAAPAAIFGSCNGGNGVRGDSGSANDSGVWGQNTGSGTGVAGSSIGGFGVGGQSQSGEGVFGQGGTNGVHGKSASKFDSGVWGENTTTGTGVAGNSAGGFGVGGQSPGGVGVELSLNLGDGRGQAAAA